MDDLFALSEVLVGDFLICGGLGRGTLRGMCMLDPGGFAQGHFVPIVLLCM